MALQGAEVQCTENGMVRRRTVENREDPPRKEKQRLTN
jgi:hypothetical protein